METNKKSLLTLPSAIVVAASLIAIAIIWVKKPVDTLPANANTAAAQQAVSVNLAPVTANDHIFGNPNADIKIVEYSDTSCPYCKIFHPTIQSVMAKYGPGGKVAWVYRHFPLDTPDAQGRVLHPNANREAQATECAALLGGTDSFWKYINRLYEVTESDKGIPLDPKQLPEIAVFAGLDKDKFMSCLSSDRFNETVKKQFTTGVNAGVTGTPTNFLVLGDSIKKETVDYINQALITYRIPPNLLFVSADNKTIVMAGALPEDLIVGLLESLLKN
jgi:protein-disulfide isomerase